MNEKEKKEFYVAMCKCCLLAQSMKSCSSCCFKIGLTEQEKLVGALAIPLPAPIAIQIGNAIPQVAYNA